MSFLPDLGFALAALGAVLSVIPSGAKADPVGWAAAGIVFILTGAYVWRRYIRAGRSESAGWATTWAIAQAGVWGSLVVLSTQMQSPGHELMWFGFVFPAFHAWGSLKHAVNASTVVMICATILVAAAVVNSQLLEAESPGMIPALVVVMFIFALTMVRPPWLRSPDYDIENRVKTHKRAAAVEQEAFEAEIESPGLGGNFGYMEDAATRSERRNRTNDALEDEHRDDETVARVKPSGKEPKEAGRQQARILQLQAAALDALDTDPDPNHVPDAASLIEACAKRNLLRIGEEYRDYAGSGSPIGPVWGAVVVTTVARSAARSDRGDSIRIRLEDGYEQWTVTVENRILRGHARYRTDINATVAGLREPVTALGGAVDSEVVTGGSEDIIRVYLTIPKPSAGASSGSSD